jgi:hypothetical protein
LHDPKLGLLFIQLRFFENLNTGKSSVKGLSELKKFVGICNAQIVFCGVASNGEWPDNRELSALNQSAVLLESVTENPAAHLGRD